MNYTDLLNEAKKVSNNSYSPYSNFCVGAALLTKNNKIYSGCNIENHGIQSICAERVAFSKAISDGETYNAPNNYVAILIIGHDKDSDNYKETLPCGYCRQFISEFVNPDFKILSYDGNDIKEYTLESLLPMSFKL